MGIIDRIILSIYTLLLTVLSMIVILLSLKILSLDYGLKGMSYIYGHWEAALVGGIFLATCLGVSMAWLTPFSRLQAGLIGFIVCLFGFFGGLVMSAIKRDRGVKDWGQLIHGHGGMLDRIDSICFSAPIFFHILRYWWN